MYILNLVGVIIGTILSLYITGPVNKKI